MFSHTSSLLAFSVAFITSALAAPTVQFSASRNLARSTQDPYISSPGVDFISFRVTSDSKPVDYVATLDKGSNTDFHSILKGYEEMDDVWSKAFLESVFVAAGECGSQWSARAKHHLKSRKVSSKIASIHSASSFVGTKRTRAGPYVVSSVGEEGDVTLSPVYRVYTDSQYAFTYGVLPRVETSSNASLAAFVQAPIGGIEGFGMSAIGVPVPSRLYTLGEKSASKPLAGIRIAVKDIYDIAGLKTGDGNRAYYDFYPAAEKSSFVVERLLGQGAIVVGKTKTSQFANGENPTADWVDQLCPFNPRGDGYQNPSSSSSGSGAAMGAYDWLDSAIGSDTGGSVRFPASVQGLYGIRPTFGAVSLTGVMPLAAQLDTAGYFARTPELFKTFGEAIYQGSFENYDSFPKVIKTPSDFWNSTLSSLNNSVPSIFSRFVDQLALLLDENNSTQVDNTPFASVWNQTSGINETAAVYTNLTYPILIGNYQYKEFAVPFIESYRNATGVDPFIDPVPLYRWNWAVQQGDEAYEDHINRQLFFAKWIDENFMRSSDSGSCSESLLVYPQNVGRPDYRNVYRPPPGIPFGFSASRLSNIGGIPEIIIPIDQVQYNSTITNTDDQYLPITVSVLAAKGCDLMLLDLVKKMKSAGIVKDVLTGSKAFA
ncbi:amidase signature enzyme [Violaceomyces palustris]|uniref:Amidase signature enzyme n=1 Tax=Violaceomyces palustris TaxID=1673888 RepID=A0ACD0P857_9BASI|nr:amidase signature enzyme [Violaceomyces palustris]